MLRLNLSTLLVTLPLLAVPAGVAMTPSAHAAGAAEEAVRLLSKAKAADQKCNYLSPASRTDLARLTARAEIAAASQRSAGAARSAAAAGRADAESVSCSADLEADVNETLDAARQAMAAADSMHQEDPPAERRVRRKDAQAGGDREPPAVRRLGPGLSTYERIVSAYYLERECKSLSRVEDRRFWQAVAQLHRATVAANGTRAVARVMAEAERKASGSPCSGAAVAEIEKGYQEISGR